MADDGVAVFLAAFIACMAFWLLTVRAMNQ